jgi:hypothetical protein
MKRVEAFQYDVDKGERIDLHVTPHHVPPTMAAALDGEMLTPKDQGRFSFIITKPIESAHFLTLSFEFPPNSGSDAFYEVDVKGSVGGETDSFIERDSSLQARVLEFRVKGDTGPK